jgi:hypothetical protein
MDKDGRRHVGLYLDAKNYDSWKFGIKLALQSDELWGVVNGTERKPELVRTNTLYICMLTCWVLVSQRAHMWSVCASYQRGSLVVICMEILGCRLRIASAYHIPPYQTSHRRLLLNLFFTLQTINSPNTTTGSQLSSPSFICPRVLVISIYYPSYYFVILIQITPSYCVWRRSYFEFDIIT